MANSNDRAARSADTNHRGLRKRAGLTSPLLQDAEHRHPRGIDGRAQNLRPGLSVSVTLFSAVSKRWYAVDHLAGLQVCYRGRPKKNTYPLGSSSSRPHRPLCVCAIGKPNQCPRSAYSAASASGSGARPSASLDFNRLRLGRCGIAYADNDVTDLYVGDKPGSPGLLSLATHNH